MNRLAVMLYIIIAPTVAGISMVVALTIGADTSNPVIWSVAIGAVLAIPAAWFVAKKLSSVKGLMS